jgi:hypothetical protein
MKAIATDNLAKVFGHLVAVDNISFAWVLTSSPRWKPTNREWNINLDKVQPITSDDWSTTGSNNAQEQTC